MEQVILLHLGLRKLYSFYKIDKFPIISLGDALLLFCSIFTKVISEGV